MTVSKAKMTYYVEWGQGKNNENGMLEAAGSLCWISDGTESAGDDGGGSEAGKDVSVGGGNTGSTGSSGRSIEEEADIDSSDAGGDIVIGDATVGSVNGGGDVLGNAGLTGNVAGWWWGDWQGLVVDVFEFPR
jgi:hypothetical protein